MPKWGVGIMSIGTAGGELMTRCFPNSSVWEHQSCSNVPKSVQAKLEVSDLQAGFQATSSCFSPPKQELRLIPIGELKSRSCLSKLSIRHPLYGPRLSPPLRFQGPNGNDPSFCPCCGQVCRKRSLSTWVQAPAGLHKQRRGLSSRLGGHPPNWNGQTLWVQT